MDVSLYSYDSQVILHQALRYAKGLGHDYLEVEHVALALLRKDWNRLDPQAHGDVERALEAFLQNFPKKFGRVRVAFGPRVNQALDSLESQIQGRLIEPDDLWRALVSHSKTIETYLRQVQDEKRSDFQSWNVAETRVETGVKLGAAVHKRKPAQSDEPPASEEKSSSKKLDQELDKKLRDITIDFTEMASRGAIDPVIGRDAEIRRVLEILSRKKKNNPVLLGEPGVGKTAVAEGIALRIVAEKVPEHLKGVRVLALDLAALLAGTKYRGEFEERLKQLVKAIESLGDRVILFIDEIHMILGAGQSEGGADAANLLKPALARGHLRCLGATTLAEYRRYFEKDAALERRFQPVLVQEPDAMTTLSILRGLKTKYEIHHGVPITDDALQAAVELSVQYIPHRHLPDKAIDLVDEACARLKLQLQTVPAELEAVHSQIAQLKMEQQLLAKQNPGSKALLQVQHKLTKLESESHELETSWKEHQLELDRLRSLELKQEQLQQLAETAKAQGDFALAARLEYGELPKIVDSLRDVQAALGKQQEGKNFHRRRVDRSEVAKVLENWTGIPVGDILQAERDRLRHLEAHLQQRVFGQEQALWSVARAVRRARVGLHDQERPLGVFLFLGPTGVGKTETARALAASLFQNEANLVRIDMSEFMEAHQVAGLVGAPPGYTGYESGGRLTEAIRHKPHAVVLLDEIDKAHPRVLDILLQLFDSGRLSDGQGRPADFRHCLLIMTANFVVPLRGVSEDEHDRYLREELRSVLRPELINRIDEIVSFKPLARIHFVRMLQKELRRLNQQLLDRDARLELGPGLEAMLVESASRSVFSGRELRRGFQRWVIDAVTDRMLGDGEGLHGLWILDWDAQEGLSWSRDLRQHRYLPPAR